MLNIVYTPLWLLQLGIFSKTKDSLELEFLSELKKHFKFVELRLNSANHKEKLTAKSSLNEFQYLNIKDSYDNLLKGYNRNRRRELKKASDAFLVEKWQDNPEYLITLFEKNVGVRVKGIKKKDYKNLLNLMRTCIEKKAGEVLSIYDQNDRVVASGFFLFHKKRVIELVCSTDFKNRDNGANTFLIDRALFKYTGAYHIF